jgi:uncharacterized protein (UPF0332 family)
VTFVSSRKPLPENLQQRIKSCPVDFRRVESFIKRAKKDLATAELIQESDLEVAYQLLYDGMLHASLAFMVSEGAQPDVRGKHKTVIDYIAQALGSRYQSKMEFYDRMRRRRHQFLYEPGPFQCTKKEIADARIVVKEFVALISDKIQTQNPQKELGLEIP